MSALWLNVRLLSVRTLAAPKSEYTQVLDCSWQVVSQFIPVDAGLEVSILLPQE